MERKQMPVLDEVRPTNSLAVPIYIDETVARDDRKQAPTKKTEDLRLHHANQLVYVIHELELIQEQLLGGNALATPDRNQKLAQLANDVRRARERFHRLYGKYPSVPDNLIPRLEPLADIEYDSMQISFTDNGRMIRILVVRGDTRYFVDFKLNRRRHDTLLSIHHGNTIRVRKTSFSKLRDEFES
jgi:hypothetical protein